MNVVCLEWYSKATDDLVLRVHKWYYCVARGMGKNDYQYGLRIGSIYDNVDFPGYIGEAGGPSEPSLSI